MVQRTTTTGGADDTVEVDSLGRPIRWFWYGPSVEGAAGGATGEPRRLMQEIAYDARGERVARRSVPVIEGTPDDERLHDVYEHDAVGREVGHTTTWGAVVETEYDGLRAEVTDPLGHVTVVEHDPLGRPVTVTDAAMGVTRYKHGPFGALYTVTDPGGATTRTARDALGRVRQLDHPDRGTTVFTNDGFGELVSSTDALGREAMFSYDGLGRTTSRVDEDGAERLTTTWTWDTALHGIGKLHVLESPDGDKTYGYTEHGKLETAALRIDGERAALESRLGYDELGRVETITYPTPAGAAPFVVAHDHDAYGHVLAVRDSATRSAYWRLTDVDSAGRYREEAFGNGAVTERSYYADKQRLKGVVTRSGATAVQDLGYGYDERLSLTRRTDALQPQHRNERFRYDPIERLTCAYFSDVESATAPCALRYGHDPNGNLIFAPDAGTLSYDDPLHPHAFTSAGVDSFGYDAVGNQIARPGGEQVSYTPFDLPTAITQGARTVSFGYDGDQQRIRKTTPDEETIYFGDLVERVTDAAAGRAEHRYYVRSPERVVAIVTRGEREGVRSPLERTHARRPGLDERGHVPRLVEVLPHLHVRLRDLVPGERLREDRTDAPLQDQAVRLARLHQGRDMAPLDALLTHPYEPRIHREVVPGRAGAEHHHAPALHHEAAHRERRLARVLEHQIDVGPLARDRPDGLPEPAHLAHVLCIGCVIERAQRPPAPEPRAIDDALGAQRHDEIALLLVRDHADRVRSRRGDELDGHRAQAAGRAPDEHVLPRPQDVRGVPEQHAVRGRQRGEVASALLPGQAPGPREQLPPLHDRELGERAMRRLVPPYPLRRREQRIAAVALLVLAVVLAAEHDDLVADAPSLDHAADGPHDARRVGAAHVIVVPMHVKHRDGFPQRGPDAVVVDPRGHDRDEDLIRADARRRHDLDLHGGARLAMAIAPDDPRSHAPWHVPERRHFTQLIPILLCVRGALAIRCVRHRALLMLVV
nr:RHS repeat protein [Sorangium cellulosum]